MTEFEGQTINPEPDPSEPRLVIFQRKKVIPSMENTVNQAIDGDTDAIASLLEYLDTNIPKHFTARERTKLRVIANLEKFDASRGKRKFNNRFRNWIRIMARSDETAESKKQNKLEDEITPDSNPGENL